MDVISSDKEIFRGLDIIKEEFSLDAKNIRLTALKSEKAGFALYESDEGFTIEYGDVSAFFNAFGLLLSGVKNAKRRKYVPNLGIMLDCARNAVPTVEFIKDYIKSAVLMGYGYVGLYLEDLIEVKEEPYLGWKRGRYTEKELKEVIDYADNFGVEIVPYMETLAHMDGMFKCKFWQDFDKIHDIHDVLLIREPRTYEFLEHIISTVAGIFKTKRIHVGMDEASLAGRGHFLDKYGYENRKELLMEHLEKVIALCEKYGLKAEMWADMLVRKRNAEDVEFLSSDKCKKIIERVKLVQWRYGSDDEKVYDEMFDVSEEITSNYSYAGAAWGYVGQTPLLTFGNKNTEAALKSCRSHGVKDIVMTSWNDLLGEASFYSVIPTLVNASTFTLDKELSAAKKNALVKTLFGYTYDELMLMELPGSVKENPRNNTAFNIMANDPLLDLMGLVACEGYDKKYAEITKTLKRLAAKRGKVAYVFDALAKMTSCLEIKSEIVIKLKKAYKSGDKKELSRLVDEDVKELIKRLKVHLSSMRALWLKEKKSFGLDVVDMRISAAISRFGYLTERVKAYVGGEIKEIEEYEQEDLKYFSFWGGEDYRDKNLVVYTDWFNMVTNSRFRFSNNPMAYT